MFSVSIGNILLRILHIMPTWPITSEFITCSYCMNFSDDIMDYNSCTMIDTKQEQECFQIIKSRFN